MPAQAGIQVLRRMDFRFRGNDDKNDSGRSPYEVQRKPGLNHPLGIFELLVYS